MMQAKVISPGGGEVARHSGWEAVVKLDASATGRTLSVVETRHEPGAVASPHVHSRESETFVVLEGTFNFRVGDEQVEVSAGGIVFGPPGTVHGFEPLAEGGRLLHVFVPGGIEGFFTRPRKDSAGFGDRLRREYGVESVDE